MSRPAAAVRRILSLDRRSMALWLDLWRATHESTQVSAWFDDTIHCGGRCIRRHCLYACSFPRPTSIGCPARQSIITQ